MCQSENSGIVRRDDTDTTDSTTFAIDVAAIEAAETDTSTDSDSGFKCWGSCHEAIYK